MDTPVTEPADNDDDVEAAAARAQAKVDEKNRARIEAARKKVRSLKRKLAPGFVRGVVVDLRQEIELTAYGETPVWHFFMETAEDDGQKEVIFRSINPLRNSLAGEVIDVYPGNPPKFPVNVRTIWIPGKRQLVRAYYPYEEDAARELRRSNTGAVVAVTLPVLIVIALIIAYYAFLRDFVHWRPT